MVQEWFWTLKKSFSKGKMVGHIVSKNGVATDPEKLDTISKLFFPITKKTLWGFLGMVGYYQRLIHMFVAKTRPLAWFLREDAPTPMENEVSKCAFKQLKCRNLTLREVWGRHSHSQKWDLGVFRDSQKLRAQLQGSKHLTLRRFLYHWKGLEV
jgi:hypothetical protein